MMFARVLFVLWLTLFKGRGVETTPQGAIDSDAKVDYDVLAVAGGRTQLPCNLVSPRSGDEVYLVLWYRSSSGLPIYTFDVGGRPYSQASNQPKENTLHNRAHFISSPEPTGLEIENVQENDQGIYTCRVDFRKSPSKYSKVNLTVVVPPEDISILSNGRTVASVVGPYNEGSALRLTCRVRGGRPVPLVTWWQGNLPLSGTGVRKGDGIVANDITLPALSRGDLLATFRCQAKNSNLSRPIHASVTLDLNLKPLYLEIAGGSQPLSAGNPTELLCRVVGSRPPAHITWWRGDKRLPDTLAQKSSYDGNVTTGRLSFTPAADDNRKRISCKASNPVLVHSQMETSVTLQVYYKPTVSVHLGRSLNPEDISEGDDVYFDCLVTANPSVSRVTWYHEGQLLPQSLPQGVIISNQTLVLQKVTRKQAGSYSCSAVNQQGRGDSLPFHLRIRYSPVCKKVQKTTYGLTVREKSKITCRVKSDPVATSFSWAFNNSASLREFPDFHSTRNGSNSVLSYTPESEAGFGSLLCWATNSVGKQIKPCVYHVIQAASPDILTNCTPLNITPDSVSVECLPGSDGGLDQDFLMEVWDAKKGTLRANLSSPQPSFTLLGLHPNQELLLILYAINAKGAGAKTTVRVGTTRVTERRAGGLENLTVSPLFLAVAGGVGSLLLFISVVCLVSRICQGKKRKRWKKNDYQEGEKYCSPMLGSSRRNQEDRNPDLIPQESDVTSEAGCSITGITKPIYHHPVPTDSPSSGMQRSQTGGFSETVV